MMFRRKDIPKFEPQQPQPQQPTRLVVPDIKFIRSDSYSLEEISPPIYASDNEADITDNSDVNSNVNSDNRTVTTNPKPNNPPSNTTTNNHNNNQNNNHSIPRRRLNLFTRPKSRTISSGTATPKHNHGHNHNHDHDPHQQQPPRRQRGFSQLFHLGSSSSSGSNNRQTTTTASTTIGSFWRPNSRHTPSASMAVSIFSGRPRIHVDGVFEGEAEMDAAGSVQKRHRDSRCVESGLVGSGSGPGPGPGSGCLEGGVETRLRRAIRLHESGDLKESTKTFAQLADPRGENNALSQVLYGLALRHGWGTSPDPQKATLYLTAAAIDISTVQSQARQVGLHVTAPATTTTTTGTETFGAGAGTPTATNNNDNNKIIPAIHDLADSFRHGRGIKRDTDAARRYYELAAGLGLT